MAIERKRCYYLGINDDKYYSLSDANILIEEEDGIKFASISLSDALNKPVGCVYIWATEWERIGRKMGWL